MNSKLKFPSAMCAPLKASKKLEDYCWAAYFTGVDCNTPASLFLKDLLQTLIAMGCPAARCQIYLACLAHVDCCMEANIALFG